MFTDHQFLNHFLLILKPASFYHSLPFKWNGNLRKFENALVGGVGSLYKFQCNLHVAMTLSIIAQVLLTKIQNSSTKAMCAFTVAMLTLNTVVVKEYSTWGQNVTCLLSRFLKSSGEIPEGMDTYERHRKMAVDLLNPGTFLFPILFTVGVAWRSPCLPANFGYLMLQECSNYEMEWPFLAFLIKLLFAAVNFWLWSFGMHATLVVGSGIVMVGAMHFRCRLKDYHRKIVKVRSDHGRNTWKYALIYRQIQLLSRHYNQIHARAILVAIIIAVVSTQSVCIFALVRFRMMWLNQIFFAMMGIDCFTAIIMLCGTLADAFDVSRKVLRDLNRRHRALPWLSRFHRSCQTIKMRFGQTNFMDKLTPLNFQNFSICQTVNLLLMK